MLRKTQAPQHLMTKQNRLLLFTNKFVLEESVKQLVKSNSTYADPEVYTLSGGLPHNTPQNIKAIALVDASDRNINPLPLLQSIQQHIPASRVILIVGNHLSPFTQLARMGFLNLLMIDCSKEEFLFAMTAALREEKFFCDRILSDMIEDAENKQLISGAKLSTREEEVLYFISKGLSAKQIAEQLSVSEHTITTHRKNIKRKLKVKKTAELVSLKLSLDK